MLWITELSDTNIIFQFYERELPEFISIGKRTKVNHIEYPGGFQTNQIIGVYDKGVEWSGLFYGTYKIDGKLVTAKDRADEIKKLMGRPLRFGFPVPGMNSKGDVPGRTTVSSKSSDDYIGGDTGVYIIEEFDPEVKDYFNVEYKIKLIPHQSIHQVKPEQTTSVKITIDYNSIGAAVEAVKKAVAQTKHPVARKGHTAATSAQSFTVKGMKPRSSDDLGTNTRNNTFVPRHPVLRINNGSGIPQGKPTYDPPTYDSKGNKIKRN